MSYPTPYKEGWFWAKWKIANEGTDHCRVCHHRNSTWEDDLTGEDWAVVEVVENSLDQTDPEHLMVQVGGVGHWQSLKNFYWGPEILKPKELA